MKRITLFVLSALFSLTTIAQTTPDKLQVYLSWHPLAVINPSRPTIQGSIEFKKSNWGLELTYGQRYRDYTLLSEKGDSVSKYDFGGFTARAEIKWYGVLMREPEENEQNSFNDYLAFSGWYINDRHNDYYTAEYISSNGNEEDYFLVHRRVIVGALQYGTSFTAKSRLGYDFYVSLGLRYRTVSLEHFEGDLVDDGNERAILSGYFPAELLSPHFNVCFKVRYKIY